MVWVASFPGPRILLYKCWHKGPIALEVNQESRDVVLRYYRKGPDNRGAYICSAVDTIEGYESFVPRAYPSRWLLENSLTEETIYHFWIGGTPENAPFTNNLVMWFDAIPFIITHRINGILVKKSTVLIHDLTGNGQDVNAKEKLALDEEPYNVPGKMGIIAKWLRQAPVVTYRISKTAPFHRIESSTTLPLLFDGHHRTLHLSSHSGNRYMDNRRCDLWWLSSLG